MAITDINISEQLQTDAPSIKYSGNEGPQNPQQQQQEIQIAQQIWEGMRPEQQAQFQSFEQFFQSGIWKQILQQMQADQSQGQGIGSRGPRTEEVEEIGVESLRDGGRIGLYQGGGPHSDTELSKIVQFLMSEFGMSEEQAIRQAISQFRKPQSPEPELEPGSFAIDKYQAPLRRSLLGRPPEEQVDDFREEQIGIETLRGNI